MRIATADDTAENDQSRSGSLRAGGTIRQTLLSDEAPDGLNLRVIRSQYQSGENAFRSPRHHHAFQQVRFTETGSINYAPDHDIPAGDLAYFPRGTYYGPQRKDHGVGWLLQFGFDGEHQAGPRWRRHRRAALDQLGAHGHFDGGTYTDTDPDTGAPRERDANQALYEAQYRAETGRTFTIPAEGYAEPILIHPAAFDGWETAPGVTVTELGHFFDHSGPHADIRLRVVTLESHALHTLAPDRAQVAWTLDAGVQIDGHTYPSRTCLHSPREETVEISAAGPLALYVVELPRRD